MKLFILCFCIILGAASAFAEELPHWGYSGSNGPDAWANLCPEYSDCAGVNQSPINLTNFIEADLAPIAIGFEKGGFEILNNGHAIQVNYKAGSSTKIDGIDFALKQFHFHSPSENTIEGKSFALEIHFVHADKDGNLAAMSVMVAEGAENAALAKIWPLIPAKVGDKKALETLFAAEDLLPKDRDFYRFNGSLTTPPCSEGVRWIVMKNPITASKKQVATFTGVMGHPNNRPIQATNSRLILK